jgi:thiamine kinase-like enzyme
MADDLDAALAALRPLLGAAEGPAVALDGGQTNRNYRVRLGGRDCVVRLPGPDTDLLGIDRATERAAAGAAAAVGLGPPVLGHLEAPACLVVGFLPGRPLPPESLREPAMIALAARALRRIHAGPPLATRFDPWEMVAGYAATARARGGAPPPGFDALMERAGDIRAALAGPEHAPVPCHNDLLPSNFLLDCEELRILDWEYAGMGDRYFDLGNLSVNAGYAEADDETLLGAYWEEPCTPRRFAALRLMRVLSDLREGLWGSVQAVVSDIPIDFEAYAAKHVERARAALDDPRVPGWLDEVRG